MTSSTAASQEMSLNWSRRNWRRRMISFFYFILQLCIVYACVTLAIHNFGPNNWLLLLCLLPLYLIGREANIGLWRLLGYHPEPHTKSWGAGTRRLELPIFVKTSSDYARLYSSRHKGYQFLFIFFRIMLWSSLPALILLSLGLCMFFQIQGFWALVICFSPIFLLILLDMKFQTRFPKWFALEVFLVERGLPIFRKKNLWK